MLRDSVRTPLGVVALRRWVDVPGGASRRREKFLAQASAESILAAGIPRPVPITRPFARGELWVNPDTLSYYVAGLADTSFYSIGGCDEVQPGST